MLASGSHGAPHTTSSPGRPRLYLAVDCGGSKAAAAIAVASQVPGQPPTFLSNGLGGAANYTDVGLPRFLHSVRQAVESALDNGRIEWKAQQRQAHHTGSTQGNSSSHKKENTGDDNTPWNASFCFPSLFQAAWLGIAGVDSPLNISVLSPHLSHLLSIPFPSARLIVANDTSLLASPILEKDDGLPANAIREGVVCIAGTGSIVMSFRSGCSGISQSSSSSPTAPSDPASPKSRPANLATTAETTSAQRDPAEVLLTAVGRVGGFGWLLGDEGGGYMVGKRAVRAVLDQADRERLGQSSGYENSSDAASSSSSSAATLLQAAGQPKDRTHLLRDRILSKWNLSSTDDMLDTVYSNEVALQPSKPDSWGTQRASTLSASSSVHGSEVVGSDGGESGRSSLSLDANASEHEHNGHEDLSTSMDKTPSASTFLDPSQQLLPPGARHVESNGDPAVPQRNIPSPIPALGSYPSSPLQRGSYDNDGMTRQALSKDVEEITEGLETPNATTTSSADTMSSSLPRPIPTIAQPVSTPALAIGTGSGPTPALQQQSRASSDTIASASASNSALGDRKLRLASLTPLVFHLAFNHGDEMCLDILRGEIRLLVDQIVLLLQREQPNGSTTSQALSCRVLPSRCTLCLGGSLVGEDGYRGILVEELKSRGWEFKNVVYVKDVARRGCEALAKGWEIGFTS
ncbi:unnamed protein product [Sympodiomycopsis kandeliae]